MHGQTTLILRELPCTPKPPHS